MNDGFVTVNFLNWEQETQHGLVLLDFWADWCTACIAQDKVYKELAQKFDGKIKVAKIDVNDNRVLADRFGVRNIPFLILLKDGKNVLQMPGIQSKEYLFSQIEKQLSDG
ncbi:MAG: thioredoxin [Bacteroidetes bacterium]|nr:MAG: thioredoxin [Bacteroidota bacterium]